MTIYMKKKNYKSEKNITIRTTVQRLSAQSKIDSSNSNRAIILSITLNSLEEQNEKKLRYKTWYKINDSEWNATHCRQPAHKWSLSNQLKFKLQK